MKLSLNQICRYSIYFSLLLILRADLFLLSPENTHVNMFSFIVIIIGMVLNLPIIYYEKNKQEYLFAGGYTALMTIIIIIFIIYTKRNYNYTMYQSISLAMPYMMIYYAIPIIYIIKRDQNYLFFKRVAMITLFFVFVRFIAWLSYNFSSFHIFENFVLENANWRRDGIYRITGGATFGLLFIYTTYRVFIYSLNKTSSGKKGNNWLYICILGFLLLYSLFCTRARLPFMIQLLTIITTLYFSIKKKKVKISIIFLVIVAFIIFLIFGFIDTIFHSFSLESKYGQSTLTRLLGIQHFWNLFKIIGHNFALGFITNGYSTERFFYRDWWADFYIEDLGLLECFFRFGILFIPMYIWPFIKGIITCFIYICKKNNKIIFLVPFVVYVIISGLWNNIYYEQNAFCVPFFIAVISFYFSQYKYTKN